MASWFVCKKTSKIGLRVKKYVHLGPKKLHLCYSNMVIDKDEDVGPKQTWETGIHSWPEAKKILICMILFPKTFRKQASTLGQRPRKFKFARFWSQKTSENGLPLLARGQEYLNLQRRNDQAYIASNGDLSSKMQTFSRLNRPQKMAYTGGSYRS